ncbi:MAG: BrnA antitoxin family protein [Alphaproteobacteria bacterium]|nr:BrnA antitoxin family protein [Alphaproteobacteria bacterium]
MRKEPKARRYADDAPLTKAELKRARPFHDSPPDLIRAIRASIGRPVGRTKEPVHISLDADLVHALRNTGKGWQTRTNAILRKALKLPPTAGKNVHAQRESLR